MTPPRSTPELLAPAGNIEKLRSAYLYGADAAYIGLNRFSLRTRADNFSSDQAQEVRELKGNRRLYGALNIFFHETELGLLEQRLDEIEQYPFDAFIVSDLGIVRTLQRRFPDTALHLSTQANCINSEAVRLYRDLGFRRIILARETSMRSIRCIREAVPDVELEVFVHGAMCLAYSGRCFLSRAMTGRSGNSGDCAHSCRWEYRVLEERKRPGEYFPIEEFDGYTTVLSSKDLCMIGHLPELVDAGVDSLKIEGRMKSAYYTAVVTRAYRKALDEACGIEVRDAAAFTAELSKVSHREYSTGFYYDDEDSVQPTAQAYERHYVFLGTVRRRTPEGLFEIDVKNQIRSDDRIEYTGPHVVSIEDVGFELLDDTLAPVQKADHGKRYYLKTEAAVETGYLIRKRQAY